MTETLRTLLAWLSDKRFDLDERRQIPYPEKDKPSYATVRVPIRMNDGATASLQYSRAFYCHGNELVPRSMEMWHCPHHDCLGKRDEEYRQPYAYVPLMSIVEYLDAHGGIMDLNVQLAMNALEK